MLHITHCERDVLQMLADGVPAHHMAACHGVSESELEATLTTLYMKLGARSRVDAVNSAFRRGLLERRPAIHHSDTRFGRRSFALSIDVPVAGSHP